jgi:hypothetical protein
LTTITEATDRRDWLNASQIAETLDIEFAALKRMSRRGEFPELLHVSRGVYRVRRADYEAWEAARMTTAEMAREELQAERIKAQLAGRA